MVHNNMHHWYSKANLNSSRGQIVKHCWCFLCLVELMASAEQIDHKRMIIRVSHALLSLSAYTFDTSRNLCVCVNLNCKGNYLCSNKVLI